MLHAHCGLQPGNSLRVDCRVVAFPEAGVEIVLVDEASGRERVASSAPGLLHEPVISGLHPETRYTWTARAAGREVVGEVTTGTLPPGLQGAWSAEGELSVPAVLWNRGCGREVWLVITDARGEALWYEDLAAGLGCDPCGLDGFSVTEDGTFVAVINRTAIVEIAPSGRRVATLTQGADFGPILHHDVVRHGQTYWGLTAHLVAGKDEDYVVDGIVGLDAEGATVDQWFLDEVVTPSGSGPRGGYWSGPFGDAVDWSHANSLVVGDDGSWTVSLRWLDTVLRVVDREVEWSLDGSGGSPFGSGLALVADPEVTDEVGFVGQHHAVPLAAGGLSLYDNREAPEPSRALRLELEDGVAEIREAVELPSGCAIQGSATWTGAGAVVASCGPALTFWEVGGEGEPRFTLEGAACEDPSERFLPLLVRALPLDEGW